MVESNVERSTGVVVDLAEKTLIHVLYVDDDAEFLKVARQCLEMQGMLEVDTALSVKEAAEKMKKKTYDAVVCDYQMPEKDGLQFLKELRRKGNNIPFIMFTGKGREEVAIQALNLGADGYINKAGDPETVYGELAHSIRQAVKAKRAEEELRKSEERYRRLMDDAPIGLCYTDVKGKILYVNKRCEEVSGYSREEVVGKNGFKLGLFSNETVKLFAKRIKDTLMGKPARPVDFQVKRKDGRWIWVHLDAKVIKKWGVPVGFQLALRDITERKKAEEKYRTVFENTGAATCILEEDKTISFVNKQFEKLSGYSKREIEGKKKWTEFVTKEFLERMKRYHEERRKKGGKAPKQYTFDFVNRKGEIRNILLTIDVIPETKKSVASLVDITERKEMEDALRESKEKFERLFMNNPEAADYLDPDFHILNVNPRFTELFGYSLAEIKGKHINDVIVPKDKMEEAQDLDKKARKGYAYHDTVRKRKDGSLVPVSISAAPIIVEGKLVGTVGLYKDITQRKKAEEALKKLEMTNEKLRVVGRLTRHDIRNKLSTVTGNVYLAKQKLSNGHEALKHLEEIESTVGQMVKIFDFARTYEMLGIEESVYLDVEKTVSEAAMLFSDLKGVKVVNDCRGLTVLADSLLRQLFYNLIDNSLKYGEKISRIRVHYEEAGQNQLKLVYEDDGVGIPKAEKEKIFMEGHGRGTGYGLYLIRKICKVYGWTIRETGKHGKGAEFTITIPKENKKGKTLYKLQK